MTNRQLYMEKRKEVHTPEEFLAAFEDNTAIVFEFSRERTPTSKSNLFGGIWQKFDYKTTVVKKMNLLVDYGNLLVTVRHLSQADHDAMKEEEAL